MQEAAFNVRRWALISLINFMVVALLGVIMRYKIGFEFPFLSQKFLQNAHSHFAFAGWVSQSLMLLMVLAISPGLTAARNRLYHNLLVFNLLSAAGMLFSFLAQGYGSVAIFFSTLSIFVSYGFALVFFNDLRASQLVRQKGWFYAALIFNVISTFGTASLVYMLVHGHMHQSTYLASIYWYLHFQYNGWFSMACLGLLAHYYHSCMEGVRVPSCVFHLFFWSVFLTYGLSVLWMKISIPVYILIIIAAFAQLIAWGILWKKVMKGGILKQSGIDFTGRVLYRFIAIAFTIKLVLQAASVEPGLNNTVFGFRNIVIAYLHLILLAIISVALVTFFYSNRLIRVNALTVNGIKILIAGIFINEAALAVQGVASFKYIPIPYINELLFIISLLMLAGILVIIAGQSSREKG